MGAGSTTGGTTVGGTTTGGTVGAGVTGTITTPGAEGTLTVESAPISNSTVYEGESGDTILAFKAKARTSDIAVQRVKLDLGTNSQVYSKVFSRISLVDDSGRTLASSDLNSNTVVKDSDNRYYITLTGFSSVVPMDGSLTYSVKADVRSSIDSSITSQVVRIAASGVRGVDGAGIDLYAPAAATDVSRTVTIGQSLVESATLAVSTDASTPITQEIVAAGGSSNNEADKVQVLVFDLRADKDDVTMTDLAATITSAGGTGATASTTYLFAGAGTSGQLLGSASLSGSTATFSDVNYTIPKGTTKQFTLAIDVRSANTTQTTFTASVTGSSQVTAENSNGDSVTASGSATSNSTLVRSVGPVFSLVGTPTITKSLTATQNNSATSTATATFQLHIKAVGADVLFGNNASTTYPMVSNGTGAPARSFVIYLGGVSSNPSVASTTDFSQPSSGVVSGSSNSFTLQQNNEVTIPVSFTFQGNTAAGVGITYGNYAVGLERINWVTSGTQNSSTFMAGRTEWRTPSVTLP